MGVQETLALCQFEQMFALCGAGVTEKVFPENQAVGGGIDGGPAQQPGGSRGGRATCRDYTSSFPIPLAHRLIRSNFRSLQDFGSFGHHRLSKLDPQIHLEIPTFSKLSQKVFIRARNVLEAGNSGT
jgi:hypothetical protein